MFEALMPTLFVPEEQWGPKSWGLNHPRYVRAQIAHGLVESDYGYWGFSPASCPQGGYREYGTAALGLSKTAYRSNAVITPHASFLALDFVFQDALHNLEKLRAHFVIFGPWGFWDSVNCQTGQVSDRVLALDQGMIMAAAGNALTGDRLQRYFCDGEIEQAIRPVLEMEEFY